MKKNNKLFITEISEEDFRKLDLEGWVADAIIPGAPQKVKLNYVLDENIDFIRKSGVLDSLYVPITVAIFYEWPADEKNFKFGFGIKHLYSTRDYYGTKYGNWKVKKNCLKAIYRVHLDTYK
jgi:hypothetical protein